MGKTTKSAPAIFSFFSGAGFLDLGFEKNGFDVVFVNEYHKPFLDAYIHSRKVMGIAAPEKGYSSDDIKVFLNKKEEKKLKGDIVDIKSNGRLVGFIGGPPCPDFSVGGKNKGRHGDNGILTEVYIDIVIKQKPDFFLFENVKGLWRTKVHREFYEEQKSKLKKAGYVTTERLINALEYGAPQDRERIILVGFRKDSFEEMSDEGIADFPWLKYLKYNREDVFSKPWPKTDEFSAAKKRLKPKNVYEELTVEYWFKINEVTNHPNTNHCFTPRQAFERFKVIPEGDVTRKSFKRIHRWRYSPTAAYGNNEVHLHPYKPRRMSVAEVLAIQSLPKDFSLPDSMSLSDMFKSVGNGVPFLAAEGIAKTLKTHLNKHI